MASYARDLTLWLRKAKGLSFEADIRGAAIMGRLMIGHQMLMVDDPGIDQIPDHASAMSVDDDHVFQAILELHMHKILEKLLGGGGTQAVQVEFGSDLAFAAFHSGCATC